MTTFLLILDFSMLSNFSRQVTECHILLTWNLAVTCPVRSQKGKAYLHMYTYTDIHSFSLSLSLSFSLSLSLSHTHTHTHTPLSLKSQTARPDGTKYQDTLHGGKPLRPPTQSLRSYFVCHSNRTCSSNFQASCSIEAASRQNKYGIK